MLFEDSLAYHEGFRFLGEVAPVIAPDKYTQYPDFTEITAERPMFNLSGGTLFCRFRMVVSRNGKIATIAITRDEWGSSSKQTVSLLAYEAFPPNREAPTSQEVADLWQHYVGLPT